MTLRFITAASMLALVAACSSQPGPSSLSPLQQADQAFRAGNFAAAEQAYNGVIANSPNNPTAMLGLAQVYEATGRSDEAVDLYRQVSGARSGAIRIWDDGSPKQDGVTEVAMRRLGELGHGDMGGFAAPQPVLPIVEPVAAAPLPVAPAPVVQAEAWPENPVYALDSDGMVYYADPGATQRITTPVFETRAAAEQAAPTVSYQTIHQAAPIAVAPVVTQTYEAPAPVFVAPTVAAPAPIPAVQTIIQPQEPAYALDSDGIVYFADPEATQPISGAVFETREAAARSLPAVTQRTIQQAAPIAAAPVYQPAPLVQPIAPAAVTYAPAAPAPVVYQSPTTATTPLPTRAPASPAAALPRSQPGYAVVDGNFVYISADDIARGATVSAPVGSGAAYGVPTPIATSSVPVAAPQSFDVPNGANALSTRPPIELNGIPSLNLN